MSRHFSRRGWCSRLVGTSVSIGFACTLLCGLLAGPYPGRALLNVLNADGPALLIAPFDRDQALAARKAWAQHQHIEEERTNSIGMKLTLIPAGRFDMGSPGTVGETLKAFPHQKKEWLAVERPMHRVTISQPFYMGKYEVTKGHFRKFVEDTGYKTDAEKDGKGGTGRTDDKKNRFGQRPNFTWRDWGVDQSEKSPVVNVSHNDAVAFCEWLSKKEGKAYRLPTEAEWEYACRAGTTSRYYNGDDPEELTKIGNVFDAICSKFFGRDLSKGAVKRVMHDAGFVTTSDGWALPCPVGQFQPNNFGLYDMIGNVWEWCADWYDQGYYAKTPETDPTGPSAGSSRVVRGGAWNSAAVQCRSAQRVGDPPSLRAIGNGFRVVSSR